jgi:hypothetical protein
VDIALSQFRVVSTKAHALADVRANDAPPVAAAAGAAASSPRLAAAMAKRTRREVIGVFLVVRRSKDLRRLGRFD